MDQVKKKLSILFVTPNLSENSTGRTFCLWLLAKHLGYDCQVIAFEGESLWGPLRNSEFAKSCRYLDARGERRQARILAGLADSVDLVIAVKPLPKSLGISLRARRLAKFGLIVDVDDPDLEIRLHHGPLWRRVAWRLWHFRFWLTIGFWNNLGSPNGTIVSNPVLQGTYGGVIIPHVRIPEDPGNPHRSKKPIVAFVGTLRKHKGIEFLRQAIDQVAERGVTLVVTDDVPDDPRPHERWVGRTSLAEGQEIVRSADIVVIPSEPSPNSIGQLPAKLIDAMMLGRAIVVTDVAPLDWAVGSAVPRVTYGDVGQLVAALEKLIDPDERTRLGNMMRHRAMQMFSVDANVDIFEEVCMNSINSKTNQ